MVGETLPILDAGGHRAESSHHTQRTRFQLSFFHRAAAAFRAMAWRSSAVSFRARLVPPLLPSRRSSSGMICFASEGVIGRFLRTWKAYFSRPSTQKYLIACLAAKHVRAHGGFAN